MTSEAASSPITGAEARRAARNVGAIAAARLISSGALFAWQVSLGPWLGLNDYGIYGTVAALFAIGVPLASFGMGIIVIRDVARQPERAGRYLTATLVIQTALAGVAYAGVNLAAMLLGYPGEIRAFTALAGLSLFVDLYGNMAFDQLLARERMVTAASIDVGNVLLRIGLSALALAAGWGLLGVYAATLLTGLLRSALLFGALWRGGVRPVWPLDRPLARMLLINSAPQALTAFLSLAYQHTDKLMTTSIIGATSTGYLQAAFVIIYGVVEMLSTTVLIAIFPMMSRVYDGRDDNLIFGFIVQKLAFFMLLVSLPLALVLALFAPDITVPLFGADFLPTANILRALIWYALAMVVGNVFAQSFRVQNRQRRLLAIRAGGLGVNILLNLFLITRLGPLGAALASVAAEFLVLSLLLANFRAPGWNLRPLLPRLLRLAALGLVVALAMVALGNLHPALGIVGGLALYAAGVIGVGVLASDDWDLLYRLLAAMPGGAFVRRVWRRDVAVNW